MRHLTKHFSSAQIIIIGFAGVVLLGSLLLMLPFATRDGQGAGFADALFTATSAVCVTGLIVRDTATYWSEFGQAVILALIQIGGMGVITVAVAVTLISGKKISLKQRSTMQDAISAPQVGGIVRLTGFIVKASAAIEIIAALIMTPCFVREFGMAKGLWYGIFHSVSAFCNAGFDLMGVREQFSSITYYVDNPIVNITVILLIIVGGIGFITWEDIKNNRLHFASYRMQSKVILVVTALLIFIPSVYFFFCEFTDGSVWHRVISSVFQSVTTRTAGFNTVDLTSLSDDGVAVMIILMLTGGAPGSTAGGMKITTLAVLAGTMISVFARREHTHFFARRIDSDIIRNAVAVFMMYIILFLLGGLIISRVEAIPLLTCLFETASAVGTVGLTLGITPGLGMLSRTILVLLMYIGRVGGLTLIFAAVSPRKGNTARLPQEKMTVG